MILTKMGWCLGSSESLLTTEPIVFYVVFLYMSVGTIILFNYLLSRDVSYLQVY